MVICRESNTTVIGLCPTRVTASAETPLKERYLSVGRGWNVFARLDEMWSGGAPVSWQKIPHVKNRKKP